MSTDAHTEFIQRKGFTHMEQDRKFYVTPNHILDADYIGEALYFPKGTPGQCQNMSRVQELAPQRGQSELHLTFRNSGEGISLYADAADRAWENFKRAAVVASRGQTFAAREEVRLSASRNFA